MRIPFQDHHTLDSACALTRSTSRGGSSVAISISPESSAATRVALLEIWRKLMVRIAGLTAPPIVVSLHEEMIARNPLHELVRPGAHRIEADRLYALLGGDLLHMRLARDERRAQGARSIGPKGFSVLSSTVCVSMTRAEEMGAM